MEHKITISNQQLSFMAQENETILEAAIRAGISLNYGCSSGTCGLCKAQVIQGEIDEIKHREYVIPEAEKLQQIVLTCVCAVKNDVTIDAPIANTASDIPLQNLCVKVRKIEQVSSSVFKLLVQTPRTKRLRFLAGQYVEITLPSVGASRFAVASCPCEDRLIEFHLRVSEDDPISLRVADNMRLGDALELQGPFGDFVYDENANRPIILFAFDTGFAAIKSLLEHITAQEQELPIHLLWLSCGEDGLYMHNLCRSWEDAFDGFNYDGLALSQSLNELTQDHEASCKTIESYLEDVMRDHCDLSCHDIYVSAPDPAVEIFERVCLKKNMLKRRFFTEPVRGNKDMACIYSV